MPEVRTRARSWEGARPDLHIPSRARPSQLVRTSDPSPVVSSQDRDARSPPTSSSRRLPLLLLSLPDAAPLSPPARGAPRRGAHQGGMAATASSQYIEGASATPGRHRCQIGTFSPQEEAGGTKACQNARFPYVRFTCQRSPRRIGRDAKHSGPFAKSSYQPREGTGMRGIRPGPPSAGKTTLSGRSLLASIPRCRSKCPFPNLSRCHRRYHLHADEESFGTLFHPQGSTAFSQSYIFSILDRFLGFFPS
mmetsp:Transcript_25293/g.58423  ORF Transcript_25293/g.58423 Transcript_25293/m.58423 type:complete len:250 (+) Transcript_25293:86-835(+)